jgi:hypothetical protein
MALRAARNVAPLHVGNCDDPNDDEDADADDDIDGDDDDIDDDLLHDCVFADPPLYYNWHHI